MVSFSSPSTWSGLHVAATPLQERVDVLGHDPGQPRQPRLTRPTPASPSPSSAARTVARIVRISSGSPSAIQYALPGAVAATSARRTPWTRLPVNTIERRLVPSPTSGKRPLRTARNHWVWRSGWNGP